MRRELRRALSLFLDMSSLVGFLRSGTTEKRRTELSGASGETRHDLHARPIHAAGLHLNGTGIAEQRFLAALAPAIAHAARLGYAEGYFAGKDDD